MNKIKELLGLTQKPQQQSDFSAFFRDASSGDKKKLLTQVIREANKDQRDLIERYNKHLTSVR